MSYILHDIHIKDKLFLLSVVAIIFCSIPLGIRFAFGGLGSVMTDKLSIYPLFLGFLLSIYLWSRGRFGINIDSRLFFLYITVYGIIVLASLIHGLIIYPYMQDVLNGPGGVGQIEKLPGVYVFLHENHVPVTEIGLFKLWMAARLIKGLALEIFWTFGMSWMIYCWYKNQWGKGFSILRNGALISIGIVLLYSILDVLYLGGSWRAESVLKVLNPIIHGIKNYGYWWPPLLWFGQLRSVFPEPSFFGIFSAFAVPWLWYSFCKVTYKKTQSCLAIVFFAYSMCLFFTKARTANALFLGELILFGLLSLMFKKELLKKYIVLVVCAVCAFGCATFALSHYMPGSPAKAQAIMESKKKMVAITLDDGPHKTLTERAMNAFEKYNGRGTFFELGQNMNLYPDIVKSVYERGHEIASHTYQHAQLTKLDATALDEEIKKTQEACFKACGTEPTLIRPPYGAKNDTVKSAFYSYGLSMILWDGDTEDWRYSKVTNGAQIVCDNIIRDAKAKTGDGNIVLIHDIHENSVAGLEMALDQLSKEGYQFVTVSDLLKYKGHSEYK